MQGQWLVFGGLVGKLEVARDLHTFDFATLSWSKASLSGSPLQHRGNFAAVCHQGGLLVMGGEMLPDCTAE